MRANGSPLLVNMADGAVAHGDSRRLTASNRGFRQLTPRVEGREESEPRSARISR